jgi:hypothetical protein
MLTVRFQGIYGDESVFLAQHVIACRKDGNKDNNIQNVECFDEKFESIPVNGNKLITHGTIYVMNDNGKTVAVYYLAQS